MGGSSYTRLSSDLQELADELKFIIFQDTQLFHYLYKVEFEAVLNIGKDLSVVEFDSDRLLNLRANDSDSKAFARCCFSKYAYDLSRKNRLGIMWYNNGSVGTGNRSRVFIYTGSAENPVITQVLNKTQNFGSFASPVWDVIDLSSFPGEYFIMVEAYDGTSISAVTSDVHIFYVYIWNEIEV